MRAGHAAVRPIREAPNLAVHLIVTFAALLCPGARDMESVIRPDSRRITSVHGEQTRSQSPDRQLGRSTECREWPTGDMGPGALKRQLAEVLLTFPAPIPAACQWRLMAVSTRCGPSQFGDDFLEGVEVFSPDGVHPDGLG
jgi:hypothetical protein